jgi:hypothetical protein
MSLSPLEAVPGYQLMKQRLLMEYPSLDEETLADTLEGITDLHEMVAAVIRSSGRSPAGRPPFPC